MIINPRLVKCIHSGLKSRRPLKGIPARSWYRGPSSLKSRVSNGVRVRVPSLAPFKICRSKENPDSSSGTLT